MGLTGLGKVFAQIIRQTAKFLRYIGDKIVHYFRVFIHYLLQYAKLSYKYLGKLYDTFQRDPLTFLQFTGSLAIMIANGVL